MRPSARAPDQLRSVSITRNYIKHAEGSVHRFKPRPNPAINRFWITDEVRYGWKFVHSEARINMPSVAGMEPWADEHANEAWMTALTTAAA